MQKICYDSFLEYRYLSALKASPDGKSFAFIIRTADREKNDYIAKLYLGSEESDAYREMLTFDSGIKPWFVWNGNEEILFSMALREELVPAAEEGERWTSLGKLDICSGGTRRFCDIPTAVQDLCPLEDGSLLVKGLLEHGRISLYGLEGDTRRKAVERLRDEEDYQVLDELPFWLNAAGFTNKQRSVLYRYDPTGGKLSEPLTDPWADVLSYTVRENKVLYVCQNFTDIKPMTMELEELDLSANTRRTLVPQGLFRIDMAGYLGDKVLFVGSDMKKYGLNQLADYFVLEEGDPRILASQEAYFGNAIVADCKLGSFTTWMTAQEGLYFVATEGHSSFLELLTPDGTIRKLTADIGTVDGFTLCSCGPVFIGQRDMGLQEIYKLGEDGTERLSSRFQQRFLQNHTVSIPEPVFFTNDGVELEGFVMKPVDFDPCGRYPAILDIHGGPDAAYGRIYYHEMQAWAAKGYFVFFCNPRGSHGRGSEFADIRGKYGTVDYSDLMRFTDVVLEQIPQIDPERVGVTGGSYGGYMTNWIIGHTNRFRCAASQRSISNMICQFGVSDIGYTFNTDNSAGTPWTNFEGLWRESPIRYADRVKTPTLFIHSDQDYTCHFSEGFQMFTALKYHGVETRLCLFKGENHELSRSGKPRHRVRRMKELTDWFDQHLR